MPSPSVLLVARADRHAAKVAEHLAWSGLRVERADAGSALRRVSSIAARTLVLIEHAPPELDGIGMCRALRVAGSEHHIVLLAREGELFRAARQAGADDWFVGAQPTDELSMRVAAGRRAALRSRRRDRRSFPTVAAGTWTEPAQQVLDDAADAARDIANVDAGFVFRYEDRTVVLLGRAGAEESPPGSWFRLLEDGVLARAGDGHGARLDLVARPLGRDQSASWYIRQTYVSALAAPIRIGRRVWGALVAASTDDRPVKADALPRLAAYTDSQALTLINAAARVRLERLERSDLLTGLLSRDAFLERLDGAVAFAHEAGFHLSLAVIDVDGLSGRVDGDPGPAFIVAEVARRVEETSRVGDLLGRVGPARVAWMLRQTHVDDAAVASERIRELFAESSFPALGRVTLSLGVAGLGEAEEASTLLARAEDAVSLAGVTANACVAAPSSGRRRVAATR